MKSSQKRKNEGFIEGGKKRASTSKLPLETISSYDKSEVVDASDDLIKENSLFNFKSFPNLLRNISHDKFQLLFDDCKSCFTCREIENCDNYSLGSTFFIKANEKPRCGLENLAIQIFNMHTQGLVFDAGISGAEWWTQCIDHRDDIGFHWDRDYGMEEDDEIHVHPYLATVTYLCVNAGPTIILNKKGTFEYGSDITGPLNTCIISRPSAGKHICFDGELLHGAPSSLSYPAVNDELEGLRVTFLVNVWIDHLPVQSQRLETKFSKSLKFKTDMANEISLNTSIIENPVLESHEHLDNLETHKWQLSSCGDDYIIEVNLPQPSDLCGTITEGSTVDVIDIKDSSIYLGLISESSDDSGSKKEDSTEDST